MEFERKVQAAVEHMKHRRKLRASIRIQRQYRRRRDLRVAVALRRVRAQEARLQWQSVCAFVEKRAASCIVRWVRQEIQRLTHSAVRLQCAFRRRAAYKRAAILRGRAQACRREAMAERLQCFGRCIIARRVLRELKKNNAVASTTEWVECWDDASGQMYYYNSHTRETSWEKPKSNAGIQNGLNMEIESNKAWIACWDDSYQAYYYMDPKTGESTWEKPSSDASVNPSV
jgi:hypothetical protein